MASDTKTVEPDFILTEELNSLLISSEKREKGDTLSKFNITDRIPKHLRTAEEWVLKSHTLRGPLYDVGKQISHDFEIEECKDVVTLSIPKGSYTPAALEKVIKAITLPKLVELYVNLSTTDDELECVIDVIYNHYQRRRISLTLTLQETRYIGIELWDGDKPIYGGCAPYFTWYTFLINPIHAAPLVYQNQTVTHVVKVPPNGISKKLRVVLRSLCYEVYLDKEWEFELLRHK